MAYRRACRTCTRCAHRKTPASFDGLETICRACKRGGVCATCGAPTAQPANTRCKACAKRDRRAQADLGREATATTWQLADLPAERCQVCGLPAAPGQRWCSWPHRSPRRLLGEEQAWSSPADRTE